MLESGALKKSWGWKGLVRLGHRLGAWAHVHWKALTVIAWVCLCAWFLIERWNAIHWLALNDTDDNMRFLQVRDWLAGQGWYDLRQHRLDPPNGANIHWSRIVDLPLAALMLFFRAFMDVGQADRLGAGLAPLLPLLPAMLALGFVMRRLVGGNSWCIAIFAPLSAGMALSMFMPMRVDHHGWQLAMTLVALAGLADHRAARGGLVAGIASAISVAIGMEMIVYLAATGGVIALRWVADARQVCRMQTYALGLAGGVGFGFLVFASHDNRAPVCDALSPVWLSILAVAGAGMVLLSLLPLRSWQARLTAGGVVALFLAAGAWLVWPQCLSGAYQISPELNRLWLDNIREAKPIYKQSEDVVRPLLALPIPGILVSIVACFLYRREPGRFWPWLTVALLSVFSFVLLFWQTRAAPAAQLLAIPGVAAFAYSCLSALFFTKRTGMRLAALAGVVLVAGVFGAYELTLSFDKAKPGTRRQIVRSASAKCRTLPALEPLNRLPPATIFTMVDLGPRILAVTHHSAIAGPYHRNEKAILDIHHAFDGPPEGFRLIARARGASYLLICPNFPEGTVYQARSPKGFYAQMAKGKVPAWLSPVDLGEGLPYKLYRIER
ncbi:hypothetical protein [Rhizorhapis suberifaciens]|uniref:AcrB/AcrD/AcrF family protein n=1 Tax=Rhizorhapis suberifaciens TaxID=13656 RepID=A0A840HUI0_9SPHN|nr:hypothetical protein [Rhizorhapis suberifaciens]MBB4641593.1 hypothetical protein [Rhizorhapis suberifaciens]